MARQKLDELLAQLLNAEAEASAQTVVLDHSDDPLPRDRKDQGRWIDQSFLRRAAERDERQALDAKIATLKTELDHAECVAGSARWEAAQAAMHAANMRRAQLIVRGLERAADDASGWRDAFGHALVAIENDLRTAKAVVGRIHRGRRPLVEWINDAEAEASVLRRAMRLAEKVRDSSRADARAARQAVSFEERREAVVAAASTRAASREAVEAARAMKTALDAAYKARREHANVAGRK